MTHEQAIAAAYLYCPHCAASNPSPGTIPFRCEECSFASFFGPVAAVGALIVEQEKLLFVRRAKNPGRGQWGLPGGFVDPDEPLEEALGREVKEETSLTVLSSDYVTSYPNRYSYRGIVAPVLDLFFECRVDARAQVRLADSELDDFQWSVPTASILERMAFESNRLAILAWLDKQTQSASP